MAYKRKRYGGGSRSTRRRLSYGRKSTYRRGRFNNRRTSYSGQSAAGNSKLWMRKKRFNKASYRKKMYNASSDATKYRSVFEDAETISVPALAENAIANFNVALPSNWGIVAGGSTNSDFVAYNEMAQKIFLRGGTIRLSITNDPGTADNLVPVRVRVWFGWTKNTSIALLDTLFTIATVPAMWDPTIIEDWHNYIMISDYIEKTLLISDNLTWEHKLRPFQFDTTSADVDRSSLPYYIMLVNNLATIGAASTVAYQVGHNVSYTADSF